MADTMNAPGGPFDARDSLLPLGVLIDYLLDTAVDRWHETCPNEERSLAEWLGVTDESFTSWVMSGEASDLIPRSSSFFDDYMRQAVDR